jgi:hypothetical protein
MMTPGRLLRLAGLLLAGSLLVACGRVGTLEQPAPLYGAKAKADYQARKAAEAAAATKHRDDGGPEPITEAAPLNPPLPGGAAPPPPVIKPDASAPPTPHALTP